MKTTITVEFNKRVDNVLELMGQIDAQCSEDQDGKSWAEGSEYKISVQHQFENTVSIYGQEFIFMKDNDEEFAYVEVECPHLAKALAKKAKEMGYSAVDYKEDEDGDYSVGIKKIR